MTVETFGFAEEEGCAGFLALGHDSEVATEIQLPGRFVGEEGTFVGGDGESGVDCCITRSGR